MVKKYWKQLMKKPLEEDISLLELEGQQANMQPA